MRCRTIARTRSSQPESTLIAKIDMRTPRWPFGGGGRGSSPPAGRRCAPVAALEPPALHTLRPISDAKPSQNLTKNQFLDSACAWRGKAFQQLAVTRLLRCPQGLGCILVCAYKRNQKRLDFLVENAEVQFSALTLRSRRVGSLGADLQHADLIGGKGGTRTLDPGIMSAGPKSRALSAWC